MSHDTIKMGNVYEWLLLKVWQKVEKMWRKVKKLSHSKKKKKKRNWYVKLNCSPKKKLNLSLFEFQYENKNKHTHDQLKLASDTQYVLDLPFIIYSINGNSWVHHMLDTKIIQALKISSFMPQSIGKLLKMFQIIWRSIKKDYLLQLKY